MVERYPKDSPTPNWPKTINPDKFSNYCDPVRDAVRAALRKNDETKILQKLESSSSLSEEERERLRLAYNERVDYIWMLAGK